MEDDNRIDFLDLHSRPLDDLQNQIYRLNLELKNYGYSPINFEGQNENFSISLVTTLYGLLNQQQNTLKIRSDYEDRYKRIEYDYDNAVATSDRLRNKLEASSRENVSLQNKFILMEAETREKNEKYQKLLEETKQLRSNHQYNKNQFAVELRKYEAEVFKIKERLNKMVGDKYKSAKVGVVVINSSSKPGFRTLDSESLKTNDDYYTDIVQSYVSREEKFVNLYSQLSKCFIDLYNGVQEVFNKRKVSGGTINVKLSPVNLTVDGNAEKVEENINQLLKAVDLSLENLFGKLKPPPPVETFNMETQTTPDDSLGYRAPVINTKEFEKIFNDLKTQVLETSRLKKLLDEHKETIEKQKELLDKVIYENTYNQIPQPSSPDVTATEIEALQMELEEKRQAIEADRHKITEAALLLGHQKVQLQKDRAAFLEEKDKFTSEHILSSLSETPQWIREASQARNSLGANSSSQLSISDLIDAGAQIELPQTRSPTGARGATSTPVTAKKSRARPESSDSNTAIPTAKSPTLKDRNSRGSTGLSRLMQPTATAILRQQATQAEREERMRGKPSASTGLNKTPLREASRAHALSPTPCSKPNCAVHRKILENKKGLEKGQGSNPSQKGHNPRSFSHG